MQIYILHINVWNYRSINVFCIVDKDMSWLKYSINHKYKLSKFIKLKILSYQTVVLIDI